MQLKVNFVNRNYSLVTQVVQKTSNDVFGKTKILAIYTKVFCVKTVFLSLHDS